MPLPHILYDSLQCEWGLFDASWFARLAMLLMFCGHIFLPILFWIRRLQQPNARTFLDYFTVAMALSGLLIAFTSIAIMVLNTTWRAPGRYPEKFKKHCNEPTTIDLFLKLVHRAKLVEMKMSLFLCVCLQSIALFTSPTASFLKTNAWCTHTISLDVSQARGDLDSLMINASVAWFKLLPRTCPSLGLSSIIVPLASCSYILAFIGAMTPLAILLSLLLSLLLRLIRRNEGGMLSKWEEMPPSFQYQLLTPKLWA